jgi:hypothetical protein
MEDNKSATDTAIDTTSNERVLPGWTVPVTAAAIFGLGLLAGYFIGRK